jgi:hypothetical protein
MEGCLNHTHESFDIARMFICESQTFCRFVARADLSRLPISFVVEIVETAFEITRVARMAIERTAKTISMRPIRRRRMITLLS